MNVKGLMIISGGQTGVDRAALDAALELDCACGGWCPAGRLAEDGPIATRYPLREMTTANYLQRTRQNVIDSDATLIVYFTVLQGGTRRTLDFCRSETKPFLSLNLDDVTLDLATDRVIEFIRNHNIRVLNIAGPRASKESRAYPQTHKLIKQVLMLL